MGTVLDMTNCGSFFFLERRKEREYKSPLRSARMCRDVSIPLWILHSWSRTGLLALLY